MLNNKKLFERAQQSIPGGVNSPVRAFLSVGGTPKFITHAQGAYFTDADQQTYIDYIGSWGAMILGHAHPQVIQAVQEQLARGFSFGAPTETEIEIAEKITQLMPSIEQVRMVSSGTEATMSALRLARGYTARNYIIKFEGCYHGHADSLLVKAGSGLLTLGQPTSAGVTEDSLRHTLVLEYNNLQMLADTFQKMGDQIAAVIIEPIAGNMNLIPAHAEFLQHMRELCSQYGALLIFDEVMSGFRVALGGAQSLYNIQPDLTCLGKVIGGGFPAAAFGGQQRIMQALSPVGQVYQAGTLSGNPIAMTAGLATLNLIAQPHFFEQLTERTRQLAQGLQTAAQQENVILSAQHQGAMFGFYFSHTPPQRYRDVVDSNIAQFKLFFHAMLNKGVYFAPSAYEAGFVSAAHTPAIIEQTLTQAKAGFAELASQTLKND